MVVMSASPSVVVVESPGIAPATRDELWDLWQAAFGTIRFDRDDEAHAYGGVHVLAYAGGRLAGHASVVPRRLRVGQTWHDAGYVEGVATQPDLQLRGIGTALMERLRPEIERRWPFAMLSTGRATAFYERLGWRRWQGPSYTRKADGTEIADDEHGGLMVLALSSGIDAALPVTCEDRAGDAW